MTLLEQINEKCTAELIASRNDVAIAASVSEGRTRINPTEKFSSLGISAGFPIINGLPGPLAAELVLQKLERFAATAAAADEIPTQLLGGAIVRQMKHLEGDGMAVGSPALIDLLKTIVAAGVLTQEESDALVNVAAEHDPVSVSAVSDALNAAQGLKTLKDL